MTGRTMFQIIDGGRSGEPQSATPVPALRLVLRRPAPRSRATAILPALALLATALAALPWIAMPA